MKPVCYDLTKHVDVRKIKKNYGYPNLPKYWSKEDTNVSYMYRYIEQVEHPMYGSGCHHQPGVYL